MFSMIPMVMAPVMAPIPSPAPRRHKQPERSIPLEDLTPGKTPGKSKHLHKPGPASSSDKRKNAIPVDELRRAVKGMGEMPTGAPSKLHDFVATDNGIVGSVIPKLPSAPQLSRSDALKVLDKAEATEGIFCPCITYGKVKHELDKAQKSRAEFGGGIPAIKLTNAIRLFYGMGEFEGNKALNVVLHGVTNLRNLAEVRIREEIRKTIHLDKIEKAQQYVSQAPMEMRKLFPDRLPEIDISDALDYALADGETRADSLLGRFKNLLDEKASRQPVEVPEAEAPTARDPMQRLSPGVSPEGIEDTPVEDGKTGADSVVDRFKHLLGSEGLELPGKLFDTELPATPDPSQRPLSGDPPEVREDRPGGFFSFASREKKTNKDGQPKKPEEDRPKKSKEDKPKKPKGEKPRKPKTKPKTEIKKSEKSKGKQVDRENVPPIPKGAQPDDEADETAQEPDSALGGLSQVRLDRSKSIVEIPANARVHSISDDTFVIDTRPQRSHSLDLDDVVPLDKARLSHILEHDQVIPAKPAPEEHRLSKDTVIPKSAVTPGHLLEEGDPVVSGPRQVFSHEILDDPVVERAKASLPHSLDSDKRIAEAANQARAHSLATDTVLPAAPRSGAAHGLESDKRVAAPPAATGGEHDISRDVRILSPSGAVRGTHTIEEDEVIREGAQFRKSPRPSAADMPGNWASSSASEEDVGTSRNVVGSLDAVIDSANRAARRPEGLDAGFDAPTGRGFWGRMFPKRQNTAPAAIPEPTAPAPTPAVLDIGHLFCCPMAPWAEDNCLAPNVEASVSLFSSVMTLPSVMTNHLRRSSLIQLPKKNRYR
ncbi:hypothetical protein KVR01_011413 [Diaporthe batatas]|uniref:uncharacterized protein n=1 Tax=Diaporthe batatas TaxID=748121 RepID=UPI001D0485F5|nr:uncharacterized protein KVR01_011413 [Diaporthe batatas]KAG8158970.1 hypothetical protein KVR01_011413 [Diaporthe batatas]